ncbi:MAG TPA: T9SS type A sorting domain-containing protein [Bacteroidia bacterium]|jgi:hypothetical protein
MKKITRAAFAAMLLYCGNSFSQTTVTFNYTGSVQTFTVPSCVTSLTIDVRGGQGGTVTNATISPTSAPGGSGGRVQAVIPVTPGQVLQINVGGQGMSDGATLSCVTATGGFNGGGTGYGGYNSYNYNAGGGGGASDIRTSPYSLSDRIIVGGGGGGAGVTGCTGAAVGGGAGGGTSGGNGFGGACTSGADFGQGGTQVGGGAGGTYWGATGSGALGSGGAGASCCSVTCGSGGGGGGGYYGGGGGSDAGGGGGSNYAYGSATSVTHSQGFQTGNGQVIITYTPGIPANGGPISGPTSVCAGSTVTYTTGAVSGATSYSWTVPPGAVINSGQGTTSISVTFGSASGTITMTPANSCGSSTPSSLSVTVNANPSVNLGPNQTQCGGSVTLNAGNPGSTYLWSNSATTQTINVSSTGTYSVVVTNSSGCTGTGSVNVTINTPPTVNLGPNVTQCGGSVTLNAGNPGSTYLWSNSSTTQTISVSSSGTYSVTVTAANGCTGTGTVNVTINTAPTVNLGPNITQCGGSATLNAGNPGATYLWSNNATTQTISVSSSGTYSVTVTAANGCTATGSVNVTINTPPTVNLGPDVTQCDGSVTLDALNPGSSYAWSTSETTQTIIAASTGTYSVVVTDANGCTGMDQVNITINIPPSVNLGNDVTQCGGSVVVDAQNAGSTYLWSDNSTTQTITVSSSGTYSVVVTDASGCTGFDAINITINPLPIVSLALNPVNVCVNWSAYTLTGGSPSGGTYSGTGVSSGNFDPSVAGIGTHTITYTYSDVNGCTDSASQTITVNACTGVNNVQDDGLFSVFPNPSSGTINIVAGEEMHSAALEIRDIQGRMVYSRELGTLTKNKNVQLDLSSLANGTYMIKISSGNAVRTQKLLINK